MKDKVTKAYKETRSVIENLAVFAIIGGLVAFSIHKGLFTLTPDQLVAIGSVGLGFMVFRRFVHR